MGIQGCQVEGVEEGEEGVVGVGAVVEEEHAIVCLGGFETALVGADFLGLLFNPCWQLRHRGRCCGASRHGFC